ncbi:hypothetical protein [Streptomyces sp. NBC_01353]|uniref:hypothetical protein n=1 Tax=Streptomyces sp. NBC_01353 TaxID=2903835 RepID=UPI002E35F2F3|nr:hypothetical protein [Streptomyces sp. NBC_01353]
MPNSAYIVNLKATSPDGPTDDLVMTTNLELVTSRPFTDDELRDYAVEQIASKSGKPTADIEVVSFTYTALPTV